MQKQPLLYITHSALRACPLWFYGTANRIFYGWMDGMVTSFAICQPLLCMHRNLLPRLLCEAYHLAVQIRCSKRFRDRFADTTSLLFLFFFLLFAGQILLSSAKVIPSMLRWSANFKGRSCPVSHQSGWMEWRGSGANMILYVALLKSNKSNHWPTE